MVKPVLRIKLVVVEQERQVVLRCLTRDEAPGRMAANQGLGALGVLLEALSWPKVAKPLVVVSGLVPRHPGYNREGNSRKAWRRGLRKVLII